MKDNSSPSRRTNGNRLVSPARSLRGSRVVITGASGHLGRLLCQRLADLRCDVHGIDVADAPPGVRGRVRFSRIDLRNQDALDEALAGAAVVIHTAGLHGKHLGSIPERLLYDLNVAMTRSIVTACERVGVARLMFTSTTSLYGASARDPAGGLFLDERAPPRPVDGYDLSKLDGEQLCKTLAATAATSVVILRVARFHVADPIQHGIRLLFRTVDIRDVVEAHVLALATPLRGCHTINIVGSNALRPSAGETLLMAADTVVEAQFPGAVDLLKTVGATLPSRLDRVYVGDAAARLIGYRPRYDFGTFLRVLAARTTRIACRYEPKTCT